MSEHAPTPWTAKQINEFDWVVMSGDMVMATLSRKDRPEWNEANAKLIVHAVNAFDDLLAACISAQGAYEVLKLVGADRRLPGYQGCLDDLNAAIAKGSPPLKRRTER